MHEYFHEIFWSKRRFRKPLLTMWDMWLVSGSQKEEKLCKDLIHYCQYKFRWIRKSSLDKILCEDSPDLNTALIKYGTLYWSFFMSLKLWKMIRILIWVGRRAGTIIYLSNSLSLLSFKSKFLAHNLSLSWSRSSGSEYFWWSVSGPGFCWQQERLPLLS